MKQYQDYLRAIVKDGTNKPAARSNMPGSLSLFGYQNRYNLADGFPILTTKKMYLKGIVSEALWFLLGQTNIKPLVDAGVNIWNGDAYQYYCKVCKQQGISLPMRIESFIDYIKSGDLLHTDLVNYYLGDCGFQYGKVWRDWETPDYTMLNVDQIKKAINAIKNTPESRRLMVTAIDPAHDEDLALFWCHALFQFNCRPLTHEQRKDYFFKAVKNNGDLLFVHPHYDDNTVENETGTLLDNPESWTKLMNEKEINVPKYYLDCHLYQRSADSILGVPFNISSYSLLIHIFSELCNMVPGDFIHTFGDAHIYDNQAGALEEQLSRTPTALPKLKMNSETWGNYKDVKEFSSNQLTDLFKTMKVSDFTLEGYTPQAAIKAELSTGQKK